MSQKMLNTAISLIEAQKLAEAEHLLLDAISIDPHNARAHFTLASVYITQNDHSRAETHLQAAAKIAKKQAIIFSTLAHALNVQGRNEEALPYARKAVSLDSKAEFNHRVLGEVYADLRRPVMARQSFQNAITANPASPHPHLSLFELETTLGDKAAYEKHLAAAQKIEPNNPNVLLALANTGSSLNPGVLDDITKVVADPQSAISQNLRSKLCFAAGKTLEAQGDISRAFHYFGKDRSGLYQSFNLQKRRLQVDALKSFFTRDFFEQRQDYALSSEQPVFVFGMPRSGTTLVEQLIARHPSASGAGEVNFMANTIFSLSQGQGISPGLFEKIAPLGKREFHKIGQKYITEIQKFDKKAKRTVDKMPHNFERLWLLSILFPKAAFIHLERSPADTCSSIYTTPLDSFHSYNIDQETLGEYYCMYRELMDHWQEVLPVSIRHQSYEAMVDDFPDECRAIIEHCGLPWDSACLEHHLGDQQIFTFSKEQARQKIFRSSVNRWRKYETEIQPLLKALGPYAPS